MDFLLNNDSNTLIKGKRVDVEYGVGYGLGILGGAKLFAGALVVLVEGLVFGTDVV